jgi:uncharacterized protein (DUF302 family)
MKYFAIVVAVGSAFFLSACTGKSGQTTFIHTIPSEYNTTETMKRFTKALSAKHYTLTHTLDHTPLAAQEKMYLKPTISFELAQPMIDSKLLDCNPTLSTDLPVRIGVYRALSGAVTLVYTDPEYWSLKHNIKDQNCLELVKIMAADLDEATHAIAKPKK